MFFYRLKRKKAVKGKDEKGNIFEIKITSGEEVSEETFIELSNGRGEPNNEQQ